MSELFDAVKRNSSSDVKKILKSPTKKIDINIRDSNGNNTLLLAVQNGYLQMVDILIKYGADVNVKNNEKNTPIIISAMNGYTQITNVLIRAGADINSQNLNNETALIVATQKGHIQIVDSLIKAGANINIQNNEGMTALMIVINKYNTKIIDMLIKVGADVNIKNNEGNTALMMAIRYNKYDLVSILIKAGADVNIQNNEGKTALMMSVEGSNIQITELLIKTGADVNIQRTINNNFALIYAISKQNFKITEMLIKAGTNPKLKNSDGATALIVASYYDDSKYIDLLVKAGNDINSKMNDGSTSLMIAARRGNKNTLNSLIRLGADLNIQDNEGKTALILAVLNDHVNTVKELIDAGANTQISNNDGKTVIDYAKNYDIRKLLNLNYPKWKGFTDTDMDKFKTIFEVDAPPGTQPPAVNYSCCPICLAWVERSEACMYMKHNCTTEEGVTFVHMGLYQKYEEEGIIQWCTICGRICSSHKHYTLTSPDGPKATIIPSKPGADPFGGEKSCLAYGGGGLDEKLARFRMLRSTALKLQKEVGIIGDVPAFDKLVEACWDAYKSDSKKLRNINASAKNFREIPSSNFPSEKRTTNKNKNNKNNKNNNTSLLNVVKPDGIPNTRIVESNANEMNFMANEARDGNPMLEITYENGYKERITQDTLKNFIETQNRDFGLPSFGHCLMYPECKMRLYPSDIKEFVEPNVYEEYRKHFNKKFQKVGGRRRLRKTKRNRKL